MSKEETTNELLLKWYFKGFHDELKGTSSIMPDEKIFIRAYSIGAIDAIVGDDVSSSDYQSEEDILKIIKKSGY